MHYPREKAIGPACLRRFFAGGQLADVESHEALAFPRPIKDIPKRYSAHCTHDRL